MTPEEITQFKNTIQKTILPEVINISNEQMAGMIQVIQNQNPNLPEGFGNMLLEQLLQMKEKEKQEIRSTTDTTQNISQPTDNSNTHDLSKLF